MGKQKISVSKALKKCVKNGTESGRMEAKATEIEIHYKKNLSRCQKGKRDRPHKRDISFLRGSTPPPWPCCLLLASRPSSLLLLPTPPCHIPLMWGLCLLLKSRRPKLYSYCHSSLDQAQTAAPPSQTAAPFLAPCLRPASPAQAK